MKLNVAKGSFLEFKETGFYNHLTGKPNAGFHNLAFNRIFVYTR